MAREGTAAGGGGGGGGGAGGPAAGRGGRSLLALIAELISWRRPLRSALLFMATNVVFWFMALSSWRLYYLLTLCLVAAVTVQMIKDMALSRKRGANLWRSMTQSWEVIDSGPESSAGVSQVTDSWMSFKLFLQEMSSFKQQNPGKFCLLACSLCTFLAVLGRYIPGVIISYIIVLGIFLWPLLSSHEFGLWLEPVLQKLDFGVGEFLQKIREKHEKRNLQSREELSEADESALFPRLDSTMCKELSVSDTEISEVTWTDNGTFNLSEGHTPQTENSEDLDRPSDVDEVFAGGLPEFPSVENGTGTNGDDEDDLSIGLPAPSPRPSRNWGPSQTALDMVNRMAGDVIAAAVTAAIQERLDDCPGPPPDSDSEAEDFELLDQSELEQLEGELEQGATAPGAEATPGQPPGFLSTLLRRQ
ncbi:reticulophagy regulator 1 [Scleropages formosus]|uniref:Reticulophagy regulator 1 n=1 Tax=Scleropages formosus TaxID=113540 RepID=A0A8C9SXT7_SCLFO|nr:reticulophagy regulator 1 [Scleropages formosus]